MPMALLTTSYTGIYRTHLSLQIMSGKRVYPLENDLKKTIPSPHPTPKTKQNKNYKLPVLKQVQFYNPPCFVLFSPVHFGNRDKPQLN